MSDITLKFYLSTKYHSNQIVGLTEGDKWASALNSKFINFPVHNQVAKSERVDPLWGGRKHNLHRHLNII